jgi:hypothetical protein
MKITTEYKRIFSLILLSAFALTISPTLFAQDQPKSYKYAEYESPRGGSCDEFFRVADFLEKIEKENAKGLIIIYSGDSRQRMGNLLAYTSGAKRFLAEWMQLPSDRVSFVIADGKNLFNEEFWIIPQNAKPPEIKQANFDWTKLETKYLFSQSCVNCTPSYGLLTPTQPGYQEYANVLMENPDYKGLITVGSNFALKEIRKILLKNYKLPQNRFAIQVIKSKNEAESMTENFFIIPKINTVSKKFK